MIRHLITQLAVLLALTCAGPAAARAQGGAMIGDTREDPYDEEEASSQPASPLAPGERVSRDRTEYVAGGPMIYVTTTGFVGGGLQARALTLKWKRLYFSCVDIGIAGDANEDSMVAHFGSRVGWRFYLDAAGKHQMRVGMGLGFGTVFSRAALEDTDGSSGLYWLPGGEYLYEFPFGLHLGATFGMVMPLIVGDFTPYVMAFTFGFTVGY